MTTIREIDDGFGGVWELCNRSNCGLEVVRPGKAQCWCDAGPGPLWEIAGQTDLFGGVSA
jgi:hypothetical protein